MNKIRLRCTMAFFCLLVLILDAQTALQGAREAVEMCLQSVIPSLLPCLVITGVLTPMIATSHIPFLRPLGKAAGIPQGAEGIFLTGLIGGYPVGAQMVSVAYSAGQLSREDAKRMLGFCSNCGPAFIFGILGPKFQDIQLLWALWLIHIFSALLVSFILPRKSRDARTARPAKAITWVQSMKSAVVTMALICGWIILFRVMIAFLDRWFLWLVNKDIRVFICGLLELTNGCCCLQIIDNASLRFIIAGVLLSLGGGCVLLQTLSVTVNLGLGQYLPGKLLQAIFSLIGCFITQWFLGSADNYMNGLNLLPLLAAPVIVLFMIFITKIKNRAGNQRKIVV